MLNGTLTLDDLRACLASIAPVELKGIAPLGFSATF